MAINYTSLSRTLYRDCRPTHSNKLSHTGCAGALLGKDCVAIIGREAVQASSADIRAKGSKCGEGIWRSLYSRAPGLGPKTLRSIGVAPAAGWSGQALQMKAPAVHYPVHHCRLWGQAAGGLPAF